MSSQKGNVSRTRPQKHKNVSVFKNDIHNASKEIKKLNNLKLEFLCKRCKDIIEWKVKFKKYHPLTQPKVCVRCNCKSIKHAYHSICDSCASDLNICAKCGELNLTEAKTNTKQEQSAINQTFENALKNVRERERRALLRLVQAQSNDHKPIEVHNINCVVQKPDIQEFNKADSDCYLSDNQLNSSIV